MCGSFDLNVLYDVVDAKRCKLGLTWPSVTKEISQHLRKPIAISTIKSLAFKTTAEGDGVLQILVWLDRNPESFVLDMPSRDKNMQLPKVPSNKVLRWHTEKIYFALDEQRLSRNLTWQAVADEIGFGITSTYLTGRKNGGRMSFPSVMYIVQWLDRPSVQLMIVFDW